MAMNSFVDKLRLNSLYPTLPFRRRAELPDAQQIVHSSGPNDGNLPPIQSPRGTNNSTLNQIAMDALTPLEKIPGTANNPNVVFNQPASDIIPMRIMGYDRQMTPYQEATLQQKDADRMLKEQQINNTAEYNKGRVQNVSRQTDINEFKAKNPGVKIVAQKGGNVRGYDPITGRVVVDFGPTGEMTDSDRINAETSGRNENIRTTGEQNRQTEGVQQTGRESLAKINAGLKPTGSTRVETLRDAQGNIVEAKTIKDTDTPGPGVGGFNQSKQGALMYGPNGEGPYTIPFANTDDAQSRGMKFKK
jgi:hypothetical protein